MPAVNVGPAAGRSVARAGFRDSAKGARVRARAWWGHPAPGTRCSGFAVFEDSMGLESRTWGGRLVEDTRLFGTPSGEYTG